MQNDRLTAMTAGLPWALRQQLLDYVTSIAQVVDKILPQKVHKISPVMVDDFLFVAGLRRLWTIVNGNTWLLDNCVSLAEAQDATGFQAGSNEFSRESSDFRQLKSLTRDLEKSLQGLGILEIVQATSLAQMAELLFSRK